MKKAVKYKAPENESLSIVSESLSGVYATMVDDVLQLSGYEKVQMESILNTSYKTYSRYKKEKKKLSPEQSERILKLKALFNFGNIVFGDREALSRWMNKPSFGLGNLVPNEAIKTSTGIDMVMNELTNIAYGNLA